MASQTPRSLPLWLAIFVLSLAACRGGTGNSESIGASVSRCGDALDGWAASCSSEIGYTIAVDGCVPGLAIFAAQMPADSPRPELRLELMVSSASGLANVGPYRLMPIGDFDDWLTEPPAIREAFDGFAGCVRRAHEGESAGDLPDLDSLQELAAQAAQDGPGMESQMHRGSHERGAPFPWILLGGFALSLLLLVGRVRHQGIRDLGIGVGIVGLTWLLRSLFLPLAWMHQNGQGPLWVEFALGQGSPYGPGFYEIFGFWARNAADPDLALVHVQGLLAALVPAAVFGMFRILGLGRLLALGFAVAVALEPGLGRLARGESYFALGVSLNVLAAWALIAGFSESLREQVEAAAPKRFGVRYWLRWRGAAVGIVAAGLLISQGARVQPALWPSMALVPLVLFAFRAPWWRRLLWVLAAGPGIALVVLGSSGLALWAVLQGSLGEQWLPAVSDGSQHTIPTTLWMLVILAPLLGVAADLLAKRWLRVAVVIDLVALAALGVLVLEFYDLVDLLKWTSPVIVHSNFLMFLVAPLVLVGGAMVRLRLVLPYLESVAGSALIVALVLVSGSTRETLWTLPTDIQEAQWVREVRSQIPQHARIVYLERTGPSVARLPLYGGGGEWNVVRIQHAGEETEHELELPPLREGYYWLQSSLCSMEGGAEVCARATRGVELEPVDERELGALPSKMGHSYLGPVVRVGLYRVVGVSE